MTKMKIERLLGIIMVLLNKKKMNAKELADMFEVSLRTIYRDVDAIDRAGIPIHSTPGVGGGIEIMPNYKLEKTIFSSSDLSTILMGLSGVSTILKENNLVNTIAKIKSFVPSEKQRDIEMKANQLCIDLTPWMGNKDIKDYLDTIKTALIKTQLISFNYSDRHGNETKRVAEPYQLVVKNGCWYIQAYCHIRSDFRLFRLTRMSNLEIMEKVFEIRNYKKPQLAFTNVPETRQARVTLRIHKSMKEKLLDYCSYDHFEKDGQEHYIVTFPFIENDYYYNILLGFGTQCECLEPSHVRNEIKKRLKAMLSLYNA